MRFKLIKLSTIIAAIFLLQNCKNFKPQSIETQKKNQPNILLIFTDDQQWNTINKLGNSNIHTPALDRLADKSLVFNNAYCFGGNTGAVCIPSRNMLMSGKNFFRFEEDVLKNKELGKKTRKMHYTNPDWPTLPKVMKSAGYETYFREKSGSANNPVVRSQFDNYADIDMVKALETGRPAQGIVDQAIHYLTVERDTTKPFLMYLGIPAPHDPRWSLKKFRDLYEQDKMPIPPNYQPVHEWDIGSMTIRDERLEVWPRTKESIQKHLLDYYAVISAMDFDIGRLLDQIETLNLDENTIIVFTSDQGLAIGQHGLMGKQNIYEGTMKVPFLVSGPGIKKGTSDAFIYLYDILPTFAEISGTNVPENLDGKSFKNLLAGDNTPLRESIFLAYKNSQRSIRNNNWKLMHFPEINKYKLFNLENDPFEITNLAYNENYKSKVNELFALLEIERRNAGDKINLFPKKTKPAKFNYPKKKLPTPFPAGGLAPHDPNFKKEIYKND